MKGKIALVTGGSRGIGRQIALSLAAQGANVAIFFAGNEKAAMDTKQEIESLGVSAMALQVDVSDAQAVEAAVKTVKETMGVIDIVVNNAGITMDKLCMRMSPSDFSRVIDVNLSGAFHVIRYCLPDMVRKRAGRIVNITSVAGIIGNAGQANYAAAKAGMIGMTKSVAREVAARNITVNCVAPGFIETDMTDALPESVREKAVTGIPMARIGSVQEIAQVVAFLCSDHAQYITGAVLPVDGGLSM